MSNLFGALTTDGLEEAQDRLGGGFAARETDIYALKVKVAYAGKSDAGAQNVTIVGTLPDGSEYRETVYITNKKGQNWFHPKNKDGSDSDKKAPMPGFTLVDDISLILTGKPLAAQDVEEKVVKIFDFDAKKELPKNVPVLVDWLDKELLVAIQKELVNKSVKDEQTDKYVAVAETREQNVIVKAFDLESKKTVVEAKAGNEVAVYHDAWLEKNKGKINDRTDKKLAASAGTPGQAPQAGGAKPATKSLFGNK